MKVKVEEEEEVKVEGQRQQHRPVAARKGTGTRQSWEKKCVSRGICLSKPRRMFFEEWFLLKYGRPPLGEGELREAARQIANGAIDRAMVEEFERTQPGRTNSGGSIISTIYEILMEVNKYGPNRMYPVHEPSYGDHSFPGASFAMVN